MYRYRIVKMDDFMAGSADMFTTEPKSLKSSAPALWFGVVWGSHLGCTAYTRERSKSPVRKGL